MYNLLLYSRDDVAYLQHINEVEILKAIKLFAAHNEYWRCLIYEYSSNADDDDRFYKILEFWK